MEKLFHIMWNTFSTACGLIVPHHKKTDVSAVASVFGGGGHVLASGCKIHGEYEEVVDKIYSAVKRFIED